MLRELTCRMVTSRIAQLLVVVIHMYIHPVVRMFTKGAFPLSASLAR